jgi:enoyl-CoA hydratase/carnithine racemase
VTGIQIDKRDGICLVTMNRPQVMNALDLAALDALAEAWRDIERDDSIRVALLTGAGEKSFSVGADLKAFAPPGTKIELRHAAFFPETDKPIVAAVNGFCLAGGCELLGATDIRVAAEHAEFSITEAKIGLFPAGGSAVRFPRQLPWPLAMELMITGRRISAADALRWGLVNRVVPRADLAAAAEDYARAIAKLSPVSVRAIKQCAKTTLGMPLDVAFDAQVEFTKRVVASEDAKEGPRAFLEKREPRFTGR